MKLDIIYGNEVFVLPKSEIIKTLETAGILDLKLLIIISSDESQRKDFNIDYAAKQLKCAKSDIEASLRFWIGAGILKSTEIHTVETEQTKQKLLPDNNERPNYTGDEINEIMEKNKDIRWLIHECQNIAGKIFNTTEINKIISLSDYLRLEHEHILMLFIYCKNQGKLSIHYIAKFAFGLYDDGIDTLPKFEMYVKTREEFTDNTLKLKKLFGFSDRELTKRETEFFNRWCIEWAFPYDIIHRAYEITIDSTKDHKLSLPYLNKVLDNWFKSGYKTLDEINTATLAYQRDKEQVTQSGSSFDTDEFFELAVKRTYEKIESNKEV